MCSHIDSDACALTSWYKQNYPIFSREDSQRDSSYVNWGNFEELKGGPLNSENPLAHSNVKNLTLLFSWGGFFRKWRKSPDHPLPSNMANHVMLAYILNKILWINNKFECTEWILIISPKVCVVYRLCDHEDIILVKFTL